MAQKQKRQAARKSSPTAKSKTQTLPILSRRTGERTSVPASLSPQPVSDRSFEAKKRAFDALAKMRHEKLSLAVASRDAGTTSTTVKNLLPAALRKSRSGQWKATKNDTYARPVRIHGPQGPVTVRARSYKEAQLASDYLVAVSRWGRTHKASDLAPFHGKKVGGIQLLTSARALEALRDAGLLQLDSLYASLKDTL